MTEQEIEDTLLNLERSGWDSLCEGTGDSFYGELMTDGAVMVLANGEVMDRAQVVEALGDAPPWRRYEISDARSIDVDADCVALVYVGTGYRDDSAPEFVGLMSSVYVRRGDGWGLALYQQTPMPHDM